MMLHDNGLALFTDLYELTMMRAYAEHGMDATAVFSLFVRKLPPGRNYLLACGLGTFLERLEALAFTASDLHYLSEYGFPASFLAELAAFRFRGDVDAVPEGTPVFAGEPILEVIAPIGQAQLVETLVLNQVGLQTVIASKASRVVEAAAARPVVDFGGRRAQGIDAALGGARAQYIAGVSATSNVLAGNRHGIPIAGTMAHSFVQACASEAEAFRRFAAVFPDTILLVDTYDALAGVRQVVDLARELGAGFRVRGIRLDSGDLAGLAREARRLLDEAGLSHLQIFASGGLDEHEIARLVASGAPVDAFGVGTAMSVASDAPALDIAYKLVEYAGIGRMKLSTDKRTLPGRKQVFREMRDGKAVRDMVARFDEVLPGRRLLEPAMRDGRRIEPYPTLAAIRDSARAAIDALPPRLRALGAAEPPYEVMVSVSLMEDERQLRHQLQAGARTERA
jgi:nicotinate phosphoribosyltransferase